MTENTGQQVDKPVLIQKVLPDTIRYALLADLHLIGPALYQELSSLSWHGLESADNHPRLPPVTTYLVETNDAAVAFAHQVRERMVRVVNFLGLQRSDLVPVSVYIDPTTTEYIHAKAFYNRKERNLWVKAKDRGFGVDHEVAHWALEGIFDQGNTPPKSSLLREGLAMWTSWHCKSERERRQLQEEDYHPTVKAMASAPVYRQRWLSLDMQLDDVEAMYLGGLFFDVLYAQGGSDPRKLIDYWRSANRYETVREWIESLGFSESEIEKDWNQQFLS